MISSRRTFVTGTFGAVVENLLIGGRSRIASLVFTDKEPSVIVSLEVVDENGRRIKGAVLIIPDDLSPKDFQRELLRQAGDGTRGRFDFGNEPRTLVLIDRPSKYGIGANLPLSVIKPNYRTHRVNIGPIPPGTSPANPFRPPIRRITLAKRTSVSLQVLAQPATDRRFIFDVLIRNDDESGVYLECLRTELHRESTTGGQVAEDRIEDVHIIDVDASGNATSSLRDRQISLDVRAWFPYSNNPDPLIIESEFHHEMSPKDKRRYRIDLGVSPDFLESHGFNKDGRRNRGGQAHLVEQNSPDRLKQFYRFINAQITGHFKDDSESSEYNRTDSGGANENCQFYVRPAGRFYAEGSLSWAQ